MSQFSKFIKSVLLIISVLSYQISFALPGGGGGDNTPCTIDSTITNLGIVTAGDVCSDAFYIGMLDSCTCNGEVLTSVQLSSSTIGATAENPYTSIINCQGTTSDMSSPAADVWFKVDVNSSILLVDITSNMSQINIGIYYGSCSGLIPLGCAIGNNGNISTSFALIEGNSYFIQVSGIDESDLGDFILTVNSQRECVGCVRMETLTTSPSMIDDSYYLGDTITFCYHIDEYYQENTNWLHGVVPAFGSGWDMSTLVTFPPSSCMTSTVNGEWIWYNNIITPDGNQDGFWYDYTPGNGDGPDGDISNNYGDNCSGIIDSSAWNFCWSIAPDITQNNGDLSISINAYSDGETGNWTNSGCSSDTSMISITEYIPCLYPNISTIYPTCLSTCDGQITVSGLGAGPFDYIWINSTGDTLLTEINSSTPSSISSLCEDNYSVTVIDTNNCIINTNTMLYANISVNIDSSQISTCTTCSDGVLYASATGGTAPYTYLWNDPLSQTSATATNLISAMYTVCVTDVNGCSICDSTFLILCNIQASVTTSELNCLGICDRDASIAVNNVNSPSFTWYDSTLNILATGDSINNLCPGNFSCVVEDTNGCQITVPVSIVDYQPPVISEDSTSDESCFNVCDGYISVLTANGIPPYIFSFNNATETSQNYNANMCGGNHNIVVTDSVGCLDSITTTIVSPPILSIITNNTPEISGNDGTTNVIASGGTPPYTFQWNDINNQNTDTATGLSFGIYFVVVTDSNGCFINDSVSVESFVKISETEIGEFLVYPNPNNGKLTIKTSETWNNGQVLVRITNSLGQTVFDNSILIVDHQILLDLSNKHYTKGIYILSMIHKEKQLSFKLDFE